MGPPGVRKINGAAITAASIVVMVAAYASAVGTVDHATLAVLAVLYLAGLLVGPVLVERVAWGRALYFPAQIALTAVCVWRGAAALGLAPMALICHAVLYLSRRWAALAIGCIVVISLSTTFAIADPGERTGAMLNYATGVVFVIGFSLIAARAYDERQRATRLAGELAIAHEQLRGTIDQVAELASARERARIARDVHDGLGHTLTVIHVQLEAARELVHRDPAAVEQIIAKVQGVVHAGLRDVRSSVGLLRDDTRPRALADAIEQWAAELRAEGLSVAVELAAGAPASPAAAHVLYRAAQEAVTNVRKHSGARSVEIALTRTGASWQLRIADDGKGSASDAGHGFGLSGMRERIAGLGGRVDIATGPGGGFTLMLEVPT